MTGKSKILFVDDEKEILLTLRALFRQQYRVFTAESGKAALDIIRRERIHVIVCDQRMPQMLGHELLRQVKELSPHTVRLLLTGYADMASIVHSINEGEVFRFIHKPWDNGELRAVIDNAANIARRSMEPVPVVDASMLASPFAPARSRSITKPAKPHVSASKAGILVLDDGQETATQVTALRQHARSIFTARSIEEAVEILEQHEIAVLVTDVVVNGQDTTDFIRLLKAEYPLLMAIVLTATFDSETAIGLINQGRIFRFLHKPISNSLLQISIHNGLHFYHLNKANPSLLQCTQTKTVPETPPSSLSHKLVSRIASLRTRFKGAAS